MKQGFSLMEVLVGVAIIGITVLAAVTAVHQALNLSARNIRLAQANFLAIEGMEAARTLRDNGWATKVEPLVNDRNYFLVFSGGAWQTQIATTTVDNFFERRLVMGAVYRDASSNITTSGTLDPNTRLVTITVIWPEAGRTSTTTISTYLTNLYNN